MWLHQQMVSVEFWKVWAFIEIDFYQWRSIGNGLHIPDGPPDAGVWRDWLRDHRVWTDAIVEASRLDRFEKHRHDDPWVTLAFPGGDPRMDLISACRQLSTVLKDDAIRLWIDGERAASIDRVEAMIRIGRQLGNEEGSLIDSLIAGAMFTRGFDFIEHMGVLELSETERERLIEICLLVPTDDPASIRAVWSREFTIQREFVEQQLRTDGGSDALWLRLGIMAESDGFFEDQTFAPEFEAFVKDGAALPPIAKEPAKGSISDVQMRVRSSDKRFRGLTHEDLKAAFETSWSYGYELQTKWNARHADSLAENAHEFYESDRTQIASLMLGPVASYRKQNQKIIDARNSTIATLCGADPAP